MSNLLKSLFASRKNMVSNISIAEADPLLSTPDKKLFIDPVAPDYEENKPANGLDRVKSFLNMDHYSEGLHIGYEMHSQDSLSFCLEGLKSQFRLEANALQELLNYEILGQRKKLIDLGEMLPNIKEQMDIEIKYSTDMTEEINYQKIMSVEGEGWISVVLFSFEKGYMKGMQDYLNIGSFVNRGIL